MAAGLQFDLNYTFSKSIDVGSNAERVNGFESGGLAFNSQVINAFSPDLWRAPSRLRHHSPVQCKLGLGSALRPRAPLGRRIQQLRQRVSSADGASTACIAGPAVFRSQSAAGDWLGHRLRAGRHVGSRRAQSPRPACSATPDGDPTVFKDPQSTRLRLLSGRVLPGSTLPRHLCPEKPDNATTSAGPAISELTPALPRLGTSAKQKLLKFSWEVFNVTNSVRFDAAGSLINQDLVDITGFGKVQRRALPARASCSSRCDSVFDARSNENGDGNLPSPFSTSLPKM